MPSAQKIDLENRIFARADVLGAAVESVRGELASARGDACLQVMLSVYNAFFADENRTFLDAEEGDDCDQLWREFERERVCLPGLVHRPEVPFFMKDFTAELWLEVLLYGGENSGWNNGFR